MQYLLGIFNTREIAIGIWIILIIILLVLSKVGRNSLKDILASIFQKNILIAFMIFIAYYCIAIYLLYVVDFWNVNLLKDTIFWFFFAEIPLLFQALKSGKYKYFFFRIIKNNLAFIVILEFLLNLWTFNLWIELIIVPLFASFGVIYAFADRDQKYGVLKKICDFISTIFGVAVLISFVLHVFNNPYELFNMQTLQNFLFPIIVLFMNLPLIYTFSVYNWYEQIFVMIKNNKFRNKLAIIMFSKLSLSKIHAVRTDADVVMKVNEIESVDLKKDLERVGKRLDLKIGDHYMKRSNFYITSSILLMVVFICGINIFADPFIVNMCALGLLLSIFFLVYSFGLKLKKHEELSVVKKYALFNFLYLIKRQYKMLEDFPPVDDPSKLFTHYIEIIYELREEYEKNVTLLENLLTSWEWDVVRRLNNSLYAYVVAIGIREEDFKNYNDEDFSAYYIEKKNTSVSEENWNLFEQDIKKCAREYNENIKSCYLEFKRYID